MLGTKHPVTQNHIPEELNIHFFFNLTTIKLMYNCTLQSKNIYESCKK